MLVILALFSGLAAKVAISTLAAILIFAAIGSLRPGEVATRHRRSGRESPVGDLSQSRHRVFRPSRGSVPG
jgi:sulfate permease, SulP family